MSLEDFGTATSNQEEGSSNKAIESPHYDNEESPGSLKKTQWTIIGDRKYTPCSVTEKSLKPGVYSISWENRYGIVYDEQDFNTDDLIDFPDSIFDRVEKEINHFWQLHDEFRQYGFLHKRGFLFYGPAGGGKSCMLSRICRNIIKQGGIVFIFESDVRSFLTGLALFRNVEPDRQIVCVFEDLDAKIKEWGESPILSMLDGENQVSGVINVATTNYPERLDKRIVSRPRRFDRVIRIGMPNEEARTIFFREKFKMNGEDIDKWVKASDGFSFAALSEMVIGVKCLKNDFDEVVTRLREMNTKKVSSEEFESSDMGFVNTASSPGKSGYDGR